MKTLVSSVKNLEVFQKALLFWYSKNKRSLPWRRTSDPYAIWLSEIMLQQTTVDTVVPYYVRFLKKFPHLKAAANAGESELLKAWSGLGYYNRIRNFQKGVKVVLHDFGGRIPRTKDELIKLSGLGNYTAAAVASIAFGEKEAVVDGNVFRVLARLYRYRYRRDVKSTFSKKYFQKKAAELLDERNPGDFNQAVMELGATVCSPTQPDCLRCPVNKWCLAYKTDQPEKFPINSKKVKYRDERSVYFLYYDRKKLLLRKRRPPEILSGMWEFPNSIFRNGCSKKRVGIPLQMVRHSIMNRRIKVYPFFITGSNGQKKKRGDSSRWFTLNQLEKLPLTTITRKVMGLDGFKELL